MTTGSHVCPGACSSGGAAGNDAANNAALATESCIVAEHLRVIFDAMFQFVGLLDPEGTVLEVNATALRFIGKRREEIIGRPFWETGWWTHNAEQQQRLKQAVRDAARGAFTRFEAKHIGAEGELITVDFSLTPIFDERGRVTHLISEGRDISQRRRIERELRDALARNRALLASTLDPIITIDAHGTIQTASESVHRVFGYRPEELIGCNIKVLMPEPYHSAHDSHLSKYRQSGVANIIGNTRELEAMRNNGERFPVEISVSKVELPGESQELFIGIIHEITERKQAEDELRLLQNLTMSISSAVDLDSAFHMAIKTICQAAGWDYGELWQPNEDGTLMENGPIWQRDAAAFKPFSEATRRLRFRPGQGLIGRVWQTKQPVWQEDVTTLTPTAFLRHAEAERVGLKACLTIPIVAEGEVVAILAFFVSRTKREDRRLVQLVTAAVAPLGPVIRRKQVQDALQESERRFREVLHNAEVIALMLDRDGRITFADDYLLRLTGWKWEEIAEQSWFELFLPEEERETVRQTFVEGMRQGKLPPQCENEIVLRNGGRRRIAWSNTTMHDAKGRIVGATAFGVDVTQQSLMQAELQRHRDQLEEIVAKRTAELEKTHEQLRMSERLASIGTLAAGLGHDMNNILLPARCSLDVLESMNLPEKSHDHVKSLRWSMSYLRQLTDGLRLFALDPDDEDASGSSTDLYEWWDQVGSLLSRAAKQASFSPMIPEDIPPVAVAPHRLTQVVLNLVVNAAEAVPAKSGRVRLRIRSLKNGRFVRLSVTDNGRGMPVDVKRQALDPFYTTKTRGLGTGLGLSLVRGVVQSSGGSMRIHSSEGRGTSVVLMLPTVAVPERDHLSHAHDGPMHAIISVDDSRAASFLAAMLRHEGITVELDDPNMPPQTDIWIAEPTETRRGALQRYARHATGHLVLYGAQPESFGAMNAWLIEQPGNFDEIRRVIGEAVSRVQENTRDG